MFCIFPSILNTLYSVLFSFPPYFILHTPYIICGTTPQTFGVNGTTRVDYSHMDESGMNLKGNISSSELPSASSRSLFGYTVLALGLALFLRFFIAAPYVVSGASMEPTFFDWQYLIIDKLVYAIKEPERGDVIVFRLPQDTGRSLIKRIIGLPGETVKVSGSKVTIVNAEYPLGFALDEPYVESKNASPGDRLEVILGAGEYFVLGDNRHVSADSRLWGKLPQADITGRVDARLFPLKMISVFPGQVRYSEKQ